MDTRSESSHGSAHAHLFLFAALATAAGACQPAADPLEPERRDPLEALVLPAEPFDYEGIVLPRHSERQSGDQPRRHAGPGSLLRHVAELERGARLRWSNKALLPIQDPLEMGLTLDQLVSIVEAKPYYPTGSAQGLARISGLGRPRATRWTRESSEEKAALVAFLKTLTDFGVLNDPRYPNPFRRGIS